MNVYVFMTIHRIYKVIAEGTHKKRQKALRRSISLSNHANAMQYDKKMSF